MTRFEEEVWAAASQIPRGEVRTYSWIAERIGRPRAARAVGNALNKNPLPVLVPCHRVVGKSGIGGFAFGPGLKREMLRAEGVDL